MKRNSAITLALLMLSPYAWACTDKLWNLTPTTINLGTVKNDGNYPVTINGVATTYDGSNGGAVTVSQGHIGALTVTNFMSTLVPGSGQPFTFTMLVQPTGLGPQTAPPLLPS